MAKTLDPTRVIVFKKGLVDSHAAYDDQTGIWICVADGRYVIERSRAGIYLEDFINLFAGDQLFYVTFALRKGDLQA